MERAENLARILDVNETFARDSRACRTGCRSCSSTPMPSASSREHEAATADAVLHFYVHRPRQPDLDRQRRPHARENARTLRPLITTEMWAQLNVFHNRVAGARARRPRARPAAALRARSRRPAEPIPASRRARSTATRAGTSTARPAHRARRPDDAAARHQVPPPGAADDRGGLAVDTSQWNALLRSAAGYHAFRRGIRAACRPDQVAEFLLSTRASRARSPASGRSTSGLSRSPPDRPEGRRWSAGPPRALIRARSSVDKVRDVMATGLHEFLDQIQRHLTDLTDELAPSFFGHVRRPRSRGMRQVPEADQPPPTMIGASTHHAIEIYRYRRPVTFNEHRAMFRPRDSHDLRVLDAPLDDPAEARCAGSTTSSRTRSADRLRDEARS